jgi:hypothetical protein
VDTNDPHALHAMVATQTGSSACGPQIDDPGCSSAGAAHPKWAVLLSMVPWVRRRVGADLRGLAEMTREICTPLIRRRTDLEAPRV